MGTTSKWGQTVIDNLDNPSRPGTIDGLPWRVRAKQIREGSPQRKDSQSILTAGGPVRESLLTPEPGPIVAKHQAMDNAQIEVLATGHNEEFDSRVSQNMNGQGAFTHDGQDTVENVMISALTRQTREGLIVDNIGLETIQDLSPEDKTARVLFGIKKLDLSKATHKEALAYQIFLGGNGSLSADSLETLYTQYSYAELQQLVVQGRAEQTKELRLTVSSFVDGIGWDSLGGALADIGAQELIPIYNVFSKMGIVTTMMDSIGVPKKDQPWFFLGEARKAVRDHLGDMGANERQRAVENMVKEVEKLQNDPVMGPLIRQFGVLENFEQVFTEGVLTGEDSNSSWDRFFGNFETAAEGLFSVFILAKVGKGVKSVFSATDASTAARVAKQTGNRKFQTKIEQELTQDVAREMGIDPSEAAVGRLARPEEFVDDRTVHLPGVKKLNEKLDRIEGRVMEANAGRFARVLNGSDRSVTTEKALEDLDLGDTAVAAPAMSTIAELEDGVQIRQVIAKNGESGWANFDELLPDLLTLDPNLEQLTILRRGADGTLEQVPTTPQELARIATMRPEALSDADLIARSKTTNTIEFHMLEREAARRAGATRQVDDFIGDEFFLEWNHFRAYHPTDKIAFGENALRNTSIPLSLLTPNAKFGDELVGSFQTNYLQQERVARLFENMYSPFYNLSVKDKKAVAGVYEWSEDFGKEFSKSPSLYEVLAEFPEMTQKQQLGLLALRRGMDTQYEVFNRRLFLEYSGSGFKTATPMDPSAARFHGKPLAQDEVRKGATVYDPATQQQVKLDAAGIEVLHNDGGRIIQVDSSISVPGSNGAKQSNLVMVDGSNYKLGDLSTKPLEYYPGYSYRFYEDPWYIVKRQAGVEVDGVVKSGTDVTETALRTAGSQLEAEKFLARIATRRVDGKGRVTYKDDEGTEFVMQRSADLSQTDQTFKQRQTLQTEGRLFWDTRNRDRLPNVNGNQAELMDFVKSMERGTALSARVNQEEDLMRTVKNAFEHEYSDLLDAGDMAKKPSTAIVTELQHKLANAVTKEEKTRIKGALAIAKYLRQMSGVDSAAVPWMRARVLEMAVWVDRQLNGLGLKPGKLGYLEKRIATADPIRASRSAAFHTFMVFRPMRQLLLQMSQPIFLTGIDPLYVASGKGFTDSIALRVGFSRYVNSGFDAGYSNKALAKMMGLTNKEYKVLLDNFERSGALDVVDVHSFAGGTSKFRKTALPNGGAGSHVLYAGRVAGNAILGSFKKYGFDMGEGMNKVGTYNVAWRRVMREKKYKSLTQMTEDDWRKVKIDTENLSLAMTRPNNAAYQSGLLSVTTQFLAFTHKVTLAVMFQNPALKNTEVMKLWAGMFTLFGANMFGARDYTRESLTGMGFGHMLDQNIPGSPGTTVIDLLSAGLIQTTVDKLMKTPIDTESFTPVLNVKQFVEMSIQGIISNPVQGMLGPFGNRASALLEGLEFAHNVTAKTDLPPADKFVFASKMIMTKVFPQYSDVTMALLGYEMGRLYHSTGESIDLQPTWSAMVARGIFGARTTQEMDFYRLNSITRDSDKIVKDMIFSNRTFLKQMHFLFRKGEISRDAYHDAARTVAIMSEWAPEGRREEVIQGSMLSKFADDDPTQSMSAILTDHITNQRLTKAQSINFINRLPFNEQEKAMLKTWIEDSYDDRILNQEEMAERMLQSNPNLRD